MSHNSRETAERAHGRSSMQLMDNRRQSARHAAATDQAWIGWWEGRLYRKSLAVLVDISAGGIKLIAETPPPRRSPIWICVAGNHQTEWVEGVSLEVTPNIDGSAEVRAAFRDACPSTFFEVVAYGFGTSSGEVGPSRVSGSHRRRSS